MKRFLILALALAIVATVVLDAQARRSGENHRYKHRRGAEKVRLMELLGGDDPNTQGSGDKAGFAVLRTNGEGNLLVRVKLKGAESGEVFNVTVVIDGTPTVIGQVTTNAKGKGEAQFVVDVSGSYPADSINVQVRVLPAGSSATLGYTSTTVAVPLASLDTPPS